MGPGEFFGFIFLCAVIAWFMVKCLVGDKSSTSLSSIDKLDLSELEPDDPATADPPQYEIEQTTKNVRTRTVRFECAMDSGKTYYVSIKDRWEQNVYNFRGSRCDVDGVYTVTPAEDIFRNSDQLIADDKKTVIECNHISAWKHDVIESDTKNIYMVEIRGTRPIWERDFPDVSPYDNRQKTGRIIQDSFRITFESDDEKYIEKRIEEYENAIFDMDNEFCNPARTVHKPRPEILLEEKDI